MTVTLQDIQQAAETIRGRVVQTPCQHSKTLSQITGAEVFIKFENLQFTAAYKERGALVNILSLTDEQRAKGVIAMSAGNHAQAVAYNAQRLGIPATIVMPRFTPNVKVERTRYFGVEVILHGESFEETSEHTLRLARERGLHLVHPFDDEKTIAGQGTIALEMLAAQPGLETLVVPVGGGGLISGIAIAAKSLKPDIRIVGVQSERFPSMHCAFRGQPIECGSSTLAEGIAVKAPGKLTLPIVKEYVDDLLLVDEHEIEEAVLLLLEVEKTVAEGAGAVGLAALIRHRDLFAGQQVGMILTGGNIDLMALSSIIQRGLVRSGRLARLVFEIRDVPGMLADISRIIAEAEANVVEVSHQRAFTSAPLQMAELEIVIQARGLDHINEIRALLSAAGHPARMFTVKGRNRP